MKAYVVMSAALGILFALAIVWFVRNDRLHVQYSLWWIVVAVVALILGLSPGLIDALALALGVDYPPSLLFLWAIIALLLKALLGDVERTRSQQRLLRLSQRVVLLENELQRLRETVNTGEQDRL